jgi:hypothetical protein
VPNSSNWDDITGIIGAVATLVEGDDAPGGVTRRSLGEWRVRFTSSDREMCGTAFGTAFGTLFDGG